MREYQTLMDEMSNAVNDGCVKLKEEALFNFAFFFYLDFFAVLERALLAFLCTFICNDVPFECAKKCE